MKNLIRIVSGLLITIILSTFLSGCTDITKSSNYKSYELKYLVNLSNITEDSESVLKDLQNGVKERINKFDVAELSTEISTEDGENFLMIKS